MYFVEKNGEKSVLLVCFVVADFCVPQPDKDANSDNIMVPHVLDFFIQEAV